MFLSKSITLVVCICFYLTSCNHENTSLQKRIDPESEQLSLHKVDKSQMTSPGCNKGDLFRTVFICGVLSGNDTEITIDSFAGACPDGSGVAADPIEGQAVDTYTLIDDKIVSAVKVPFVDAGYISTSCYQVEIQSHSCVDFYYRTKSHGYLKVGDFCDLSDPASREELSRVAVTVGEPQLKKFGWSWKSPINPRIAFTDPEFCRFGISQQTEKCQEIPNAE